MNLERVPLIATDGFEFYKRVVCRILGPAFLYGQIIKTRRNDRIIKVERRTLIGDTWEFEETLRDSEDSSKLNTSFVERLNLTIRQGTAYLFRRTIYQARRKEHLEDHLELLGCYYNFVRPHRALKFGSEMRTPAMQAGLITRPLTFREIFPSAMVGWISEKVMFRTIDPLVIVGDAEASGGVAATIDEGSTHRQRVCDRSPQSPGDQSSTRRSRPGSETRRRFSANGDHQRAMVSIHLRTAAHAPRPSRSGLVERAPPGSWDSSS
jgi:hypothetical protein